MVVIRFKEWQHFAIDHIGSSDDILSAVKLSHGCFRVSIDKGLLINPADTFDIAIPQLSG